MHRKFENRGVEYRNPVDLVDRHQIMEVGLCWD